jgi:hypothetical protein
MKKHIQQALLMLLGIGMLGSIHSCKKDKCNDPTNPDCENYDPCYNFKEANADFSINELLSLGDDTLLSETDTILDVNGVLFKPKFPKQKITWILGSEKLNQKELYRNNFPLGWIDVTMIAEVENTLCSVHKKTKDTVNKRFYCLGYHSFFDSTTSVRYKLFGTWQGYNTDNVGDLFKISFGYIRIHYPGPFYRETEDLAGLPKGCPSQTPFYQAKSPVMLLGYNAGFRAQIFNSNGEHQLHGGFNLMAKCRILKNQLYIDYSYNDQPYQNYLKNEKLIFEPITSVHKQWIGKKISGRVLPL